LQLPPSDLAAYHDLTKLRAKKAVAAAAALKNRHNLHAKAVNRKGKHTQRRIFSDHEGKNAELRMKKRQIVWKKHPPTADLFRSQRENRGPQRRRTAVRRHAKVQLISQIYC
jgi:hypothetical protein